ncbi:signal peptidase I [Alteromonadaceae bacterium Bs31]|nr:signal peptidase I [Alteromonadaceae bacterium Bs31]
MDINLPLILMVAVVGTGIVTLYDFIFLRKPRLQAIAGIDAQFPGLEDEAKEGNDAYVAAYAAATAEPALIEYSKSFFPVLALVFVLRSFVIEPFQIPSESMVPTLEVGDFIAVNKYAYGIRLPVFRTKVIPISDPKRGDVMVFFPPHEDRYFIKRVIGLPGDKITYVNNVLYINGEEASQSLVEKEKVESIAGCTRLGGRYVVVDETVGDRTHRMRKCSMEQSSSLDGSWEVPQGHYFMMGDNRDHSSDSRVWGAVPEERIVGKAFAIWMHWEKFFSIPSFSRAGSI